MVKYSVTIGNYVDYCRYYYSHSKPWKRANMIIKGTVVLALVVMFVYFYSHNALSVFMMPIYALGATLLFIPTKLSYTQRTLSFMFEP